mgnify:FL=1
MTDLRTLAQAVVSAHEMWQGEAGDHVGYDPRVIADCKRRYYAASGALERVLGLPFATGTEPVARAILAALNAERAQGYARAMGEVVARADHSADYTGWSDYAMGHQDACERIAVWARERLPAAAKRD